MFINLLLEFGVPAFGQRRKAAGKKVMCRCAEQDRWHNGNDDERNKHLALKVHAKLLVGQ